MTVTSTLACLLLAGLTPQSDTAAADTTTSGPVAHAGMLPADTLAALSVTPGFGQLAELRATPLSKLVQDLLSRQATSEALDFGSLAEKITEASGIEFDQWLQAAQGGVTLAITGINGDELPDWLLVAAPGKDTELFTMALDEARAKASANGVPTTTTTENDVMIATVGPAGKQLCYASAAGRLVLANRAAAVAAALARTEHTSDSLGQSQEFAALRTALSVNGDTLACMLVRPARLAAELASLANDDDVQLVRGVLRMLDVDSMTLAGMAVRAGDGTFEEIGRLVWGGRREGLLGALLAPSVTVSPDSVRLIPDDTTAFSVSVVDWQRVVRNAIELTANISPELMQRGRMSLAKMRERFDIDPEDDVLGTLGDQLVTMQWADSKTTIPNLSVLVSLTDSLRLDHAIRQLVENVGPMLQTAGYGGYRVYSAQLPPSVGMSPAFAITEGHLVLATSTVAIRRALDRVMAPNTGEPVVAVPEGVTAFSRTSLAPMLEAFTQNVPAEMQVHVDRALAFTATAFADQPIETWLAVDPEGVTVQTRSPIGGLCTVATIGIVAAVAIPNLLKAREVANARIAEAEAQTQRRQLMTLLDRISHAQHTHRELSGSESRFLSLNDLLATELIDADSLGREISPGVFEQDGYRVTVLLDPNDGAHFAAVAWPTGGARGLVLANTDQQPNLANDILAQSEGVQTLELDDLFVDGFGSAMRSGWQLTNEPQQVTASVQPTVADSRTRRMYAALAELESNAQKTETTPAVITEALSSDDPALIARAAHALGKLRIVDEVPALCRLATGHESEAVRLQAMWAMTQMRDPRSRQASNEILTSASVQMRAMAAMNLGNLRHRESADALMELLPANEQTEDDRDRVAAMLALADIGDPTPLLSMAATVEDASPQLGQALAFAFQTLSPKLEPQQEAQTLVAVLDHPQVLLRRYAIQRIGELRDPTTARALEGRLAKEDRELQPLLMVSLQSVRGDTVVTENWTESVMSKAESLWQRGKQRWQAMPQNKKYAVMIGAGAVLLLLVLILALRNRQNARAKAEAWAAMVSPSDAYEDDGGYADYDAEYDGDPEYADAGGGHAHGDLQDEAELEATDAVEMEIGESGVYRASDYADDGLIDSDEPDTELMESRPR